MNYPLAARVLRVLRKPPGYLMRRAAHEVTCELDRWLGPRRLRTFGTHTLLQRFGCDSIDALWSRLLAAPSPWPAEPIDRARYDAITNGDSQRILAVAEEVLQHRVRLFGSGPIPLGARIDWHRDYLRGFNFPNGYFRDIDYVQRGKPCDVKFPWELSRLQWVIPAAQAYALTGDERYAAGCREILEQWLAANPVGQGVNWSLTMEAAMRILVWTWIFRRCGRSSAWVDREFRAAFLKSLYLHADYTARNIERADVNGNHFTADAAALVVAGAFFSDSREGRKWFEAALTDLENEIVRQVHADGVDFEASSGYHRLVAELFLVGAMTAREMKRSVSDVYRRLLANMARFTAAYMRPDDTAPLWGDHDDARTLPTGPQAVRDHRYLTGLIALHLGEESLIRLSGGPRADALWWFGAGAAATLPEQAAGQQSAAFPDGGAFILRDRDTHVFIDCGPLGLAGRGGHGHNDLLSFELVLNGVPLVTEGGCYVYTADFDSRNRDRAIASHNTPSIDGEQIYRFMRPDFLWSLLPDANHELVEFVGNGPVLRFTGRHDSFRRLPEGVIVERTIELAREAREVRIRDRFLGAGHHSIASPLHLHPDATVVSKDDTRVVLTAGGGRKFEILWPQGDGWLLETTEGREAASYGCMRPLTRLLWSRSGPLSDLEIVIREHTA